MKKSAIWGLFLWSTFLDFFLSTMKISIEEKKIKKLLLGFKWTQDMDLDIRILIRTSEILHILIF